MENVNVRYLRTLPESSVIYNLTAHRFYGSGWFRYMNWQKPLKRDAVIKKILFARNHMVGLKWEVAKIKFETPIDKMD